MKFQITSEPERLADLREQVRAFLQPLPLDESERYLILMGIDEACSNIIRHAYRNAPGHPIQIELGCGEGEFFCQLRDFGLPADPAQFRIRPMNEEAAGGMGWHLMQRAFDRVDFEPKEKGTRLQLVRRFTPPSPRPLPSAERVGLPPPAIP